MRDTGGSTAHVVAAVVCPPALHSADGEAEQFAGGFQAGTRGDGLGEGGLFKYLFEAKWNGLTATFSSTFRELTKEWQVCKKTVHLTTYEPVRSSNIVFNLV